MRCAHCKTENKEASKQCKKCGNPLVGLPTAWSPTGKWHLKTLAIIYSSLIVLYFFLNWILKPYLRDLPPEVTPWLIKAEKIHK